MNGFKAQGATKPTAMGSLLQAATYGATIPVIYGQTQSPLLAIWAANLRQGTSNKKLKNFISKLKGTEGYEENVDFLLGHNPIMGVLQFMVNGGLYPLNFTSQTFTGTTTPATLTITDTNFYFVIAVTLQETYSFPVNDYGGTGPQTLTGTYNLPLWNEFEVGPDPTGNSAYRNYPNTYSWQPSDGPNVTLFPSLLVAINYSVTVYYAQLTSATSNQPPITKLRMAFEDELGNGSEYADAPSPFNAQQIIYPHFAGCGSSDLDLGIGGAIPQLQPEVRGKWGIYPSGDADFADMIEDIFKSGLAQAAISSTDPFTQMERGLSSYDLPGCIQKRVAQAVFSPCVYSYTLPNVAGNILVVAITRVSDASPATFAISSSAGESWTPITFATSESEVWYATAVGGPNTITVTITGMNNEPFSLALLEIYGVDTFDALTIRAGANVGVSQSVYGNASITTGNAEGFADYMLAISLFFNNGLKAPPSDPALSLWDTIVNTGSTPNPHNSIDAGFVIQERTVYSPGTYSIANNFTVNAPVTANEMEFAVLAFKATKPASFPKPLGDFIDLPSLNQVRLQCRANGLFGSLSMNSQSAASDWLKTLYSAANAAPVFLGDKLYSIPYSEVSAAGNGALYTAPTASGPVANLSANNGDFTTTPTLQTGSRINLPNVLQLQIISREANYTQVVVTQPESGSISQYGVRKADPVVNNAIQDAAVARLILGIMVRRNQYGGDTYTFSLNSKWSLLSPMDLVTITDPLVNLSDVPVRLTSISEASGGFSCEAEPFVYGMCAPTPYSATTAPTVNPVSTTTSAGDVNAPIFFEPTPALYGQPNTGQLWIVVSSSNANYGGCQVFISLDNGSSYNPLGSPIVGNGTTGVTTADWPAAADPDKTNNLAVDLTESNGELLSYPINTENTFQFCCYVAGGGQPIPYEVMAYGVATLTAASKYTLMATGSGNELRRGVSGAPALGVGVDHPTGSRFAFIGGSGTGILKMDMDAIFQEFTLPSLFPLKFKIASVNSFGSGMQSLTGLTVYEYSPIGTSGIGPNLFQVNGS